MPSRTVSDFNRKLKKGRNGKETWKSGLDKQKAVEPRDGENTQLLMSLLKEEMI